MGLQHIAKTRQIQQIMKTKGTYFQNDYKQPIAYGEVEIHNTPARRLRGEPEKEGILCRTVCTGFCGTDFELMHMGQRGELGPKFPPGTQRLINGHEGVVYIPSLKKFAVVLIRGGNSYDPTRYMDDETYFEYGCDRADGLMAEMNYFHPDMLLEIPAECINDNKIRLSAAKKLVFADPFACMIFQLERLEDLGSAHNFRLEMARHRCTEGEARRLAKENIFSRVVIFGLGTTGTFIGDLIRTYYPDARILFVSRSKPEDRKVRFALEKTGAVFVENHYTNVYSIRAQEEGRERDKATAEAAAVTGIAAAEAAAATAATAATEESGAAEEGERMLAADIIKSLGGRATSFIACSGSELEHRIAFEHGVLGNNGVFDSFALGPSVTFKTMPFGFKNHLIFGSINFRQAHMEKAIKILSGSDYDKVVELVELEELRKDPKGLYENRIYAKNAPIKSMAIWTPEMVDMDS